jgi:hypothetical protein
LVLDPADKPQDVGTGDELSTDPNELTNRMGGFMKLKIIMSIILLSLSFDLFADQSMYCPENHGYINVGMTANQVIAACGQPITQQDSKQPLLQKVPVQQLIYNNQGGNNAFYGTWNISTGSGGTSMEIDIVNNKVKAIKVNGSDTNASSICNGANIQMDDEIGKVYNSCGSPSVVNNTYINVPIPTINKPQIWLYKAGQYQPSVSLTFVDGKLQSINN